MRNSIIEEDLRSITSADLPWSLLENKTVLVTGANGMLPAYLVESLLFLNETRFTHQDQKLTVVALVRNEARARERFKAYAGRKDLQFLVGDVCDPHVTKSLDGESAPQFIIHAASQASPKYYGIDPAGTLDANVLGTRNMLELARRTKARLLFFSSGEVYGQTSGEKPIKEQDYGYVDPSNVRSCYAEGKRVGETMCVAWHQQYGVSAVMVRPFHTYGPGMRLDDGRVFADFVADIVGGKDIALKSDGSAVRAFCYIADATFGFFTVLLKGEAGQAYNVGDSRNAVSILELAKLLVGLFPEKKLSLHHSQQTDASYIKSPIAHNVPDTAKAEGLGWKPSTTLADGFRRTIRSFA